MGVEGFRRLGKKAGTWGKLSKSEMKLEQFHFAGGSVWARNQKEALKKLKIELAKSRR